MEFDIEGEGEFQGAGGGLDNDVEFDFVDDVVFDFIDDAQQSPVLSCELLGMSICIWLEGSWQRRGIKLVFG